MTRRPIIVVCPKTGPTLIADSDHTLMMADYSQIELRLLAHLSKDPTLIKTLFQREDIRIRLENGTIPGEPSNG